MKKLQALFAAVGILLTANAVKAATFAGGQLVETVASTATAAGTTTLVLASPHHQRFTGSTTQTVVMPSAITLKAGMSWVISNDSSGTVTVQQNGGSTIGTLIGGEAYQFMLISAATPGGTWDAVPYGGAAISSLTGDVTATGPGAAAATIAASSVTSNKILDDTITNADINSAAGIADTKLATISTAGKVSNSATTATASNTMSAIMARDSSGQVAASTFTGNLVGNVTGDVTGNASTATALAADPADCGASSLAQGITASGAASCRAVDDAAVSATAAISDTKLATISTAGKVSNSATTATDANTASAIVARDASGNFTAGTISATTFNASSTTAAFQIGGTTILKRPIATSNYAIGSSSGSLSAGAVRDICIGSSACNAATTGTDITAIGDNAFVTGTGSKNTAVGSAAMNGGSGTNNTAVGWQAGNVIQSGSRNTAIGERSLNTDSGNDNVGVGSTALTNLGNGSNNVGVGAKALVNAAASSNNTAVGYNACQTLTSGGTNTCLGSGSDVTTNNLTNATAIGYSATAAVSNAIVLGTSTNLVGIGTSSPTHKLDVVGSSDSVQQVVKAHSSQTANIQEWQNSAGTVLSAIDSSGRFTGALTSSTGGDGVQQNLVGLNSSYLATSTTDRDAETSVGNWTAYADAAGTAPVDMTGGSPNTTCTRVGASTMNGAGYFLMTVSSGATRQGEGCSDLIYIPPAYRGGVVEFAFPFTTTGTITEDDIKLYAYDVTNSTVITPTWPGKILGAGPGRASAVFSLATNTAQVRVGLHIARASNTGAVTVLFDDVSVSPQVATYGLAGSNRVSTTLVPNNFGTVSQESYWQTRRGDTGHYVGYFKAGTTAGSTCSIDMPSGINLDTAKVSSTSSVVVVGRYNVISTAAGPGQIATGTGPDRHGVLFYDSSDVNTFFFSDQIGSNVFVKRNCNSLFATSDGIRFEIEIPVSGWDANVSMASSSTFKISSYLASGSRVTTTPTKLGEYRSQYKAATSNTSWTDTAPTAAPSVADGMRLYCDSYNNAGTANEANRYEIFIGKNKNFRMEKYSSAARTGNILANEYFWASNDSIGTTQSYDPVTGVLVVDCGTHSSAITGASYFGTATALGGGTTTFPTNGYFDVIVSENALAVGVQSPRSYVVAYNGNGHGSTGTKIRKYTNSTSVGSAITYTSDATNGDKFTINEDGVYSMAMTDGAAASARRFGISMNAASLTASMDTTLGVAEVLGMTTNVAAVETSVTVTWYLPAGTIIRAKDDSGCDLTGAANSMFRITKVSN